MNRTNEELAELIKNGDTGFYSELWTKNTAFFHMICSRYYNRFQERCAASGVTQEDLMQECFMALYCAVKAFDAAQGYKLLTYVNFHIKNRFNEITGRRRRQPDPLNNCASLDAPISDDSESTLVELQADEKAEQDFISSDEKIFNRELHEALEQAMQQSLTPDEADILKRLYYNGEYLTDIAKYYTISYSCIQKQKSQALIKMRKPKQKKLLQPFIEELISAKAYNATGAASFKINGYSSVEYLAEFTERLTSDHKEDNT